MQGNTVLVVEHDEEMIRQADWLIDMGPGAGAGGGQIVAEGTPDDVADCESSITGAYLAGRQTIEVPQKRRRTAKSRMVQLEGASVNNLKDVDAAFPLGTLTCVTGVSGSGKSSLVVDTLAAALARKLNGASIKPGPYRALRGTSKLDRLIHVDQSPIGRTPRSNPATYTGVFDEVRRVFAGTKHAKQLGYKLGRFSFNTKGGRCEDCQGQGVQRIEMRFLPDLFVQCPICHGRQFNRQTLAVRYREKSIADVLTMSIEEAAEFFENHSTIHRMLTSLAHVGLGYLTLGQRSTTLSGGEAQRIKLAAELGPSCSRAYALHPRRANYRAPRRRHRPAAGRPAATGRPGQHRAGDRAQSGRDQDGRLADRPGPRRRSSRGRNRRCRHSRRRCCLRGEPYRPVAPQGVGLESDIMPPLARRDPRRSEVCRRFSRMKSVMNSKHRYAPGPPAGFLGMKSAREFARDPLQFSQEVVRQYGSLVALRFGPVRAFLAADPEAVEQVLVSRAKSFRKERRT